MKKIFFLLLFLPGLVLLSTAQKQDLTLEDAVIGRWSKFAPTSLSQVQWLPGADKVIHVGENEDAVSCIISTDAKKGDREYLLTLEKFNSDLVNGGLEEVKRFPQLSFKTGDEFRFEIDRTIYHYSLSKGTVTTINSYQEGAEHVEYHKNGSVAYTLDDNLWLSLPGKKDAQVTNEGEGITNGLAAHRFEFGIDRGIFWGNTGNYVAWYRVDETMVTDYGMYDFSKKPAGTDVIKYPMAGDKSHQATLGICDVKTMKTWFVEVEGDPEQYLTNIFWGPDDKNIYIAVLNRDQNHLKLQQFDVATGGPGKTLFERKEETFVQPLHPGFFIPNSPNEFLWMSDRDGFLHLYRYNTDGKMLGQLTSGNWMVTDFHGFDESGRYAYFSSTKASPVERHAHRIDLKTGKITDLSSGKGNHTPVVQKEGNYILDIYQSSQVPLTYMTVETKSGKPAYTLSVSPNPMREVNLGDMQIFTIEASDGSELYCRMITPPDFDPKKKYPVINYLYGGPGVQIIRDVWLGAAPLWMYYAAQEGYIVFTLENRGSANRGRKFEQATFRNLGTVEMEDQLTGVEWLKKQPYIDGDRMGIHGWSFGGFMTTTMMLRAPGVFKAGVAGGPVIDWRMYEIMYTERYMDTPQINEEGYETSNLMNHVDSLQGDLLLIHGTSDDVVLWQHSLAFLDKCIKSGVQVDYFVYPSHPHNVRGRDRVHLMRKVLDYLMDRI